MRCSKICVFLTICIILSGCYTSHKAARQIVRAQATHPEVVASMCGSFYEPEVYTRDSMIYIQGETQYVKGDTVIINCDTVRISDAGKRLVMQYQASSMLRVDTIYISREKQVENKALIVSKNSEINKLQMKIYDQAARLKLLWWAVCILGVYTTARWVIKYFTGFSLP